MPSVEAAALPILSPNGRHASAEAVTSSVAQGRLRKSPYVPLRNVSCSFREGVLTLCGRVPSYYLKQIAQSLMSDLPAVREIRNELSVGPSRQGRSPDARRPETVKE